MPTELDDRLAALHAILGELLDRLIRIRAAQLALQQHGTLLADLKTAATEARSATLQ